MNKQVLSPFDCDMCPMIEDITKQEIEVTASDTSIRLSWAQNGSEGNDKAEGQRIEALKQAIRGRLGDRLIEFFYADGNGIFVDVPESWYIIRELNGRFTARPEKDFKREFEPKGTPAENYTEQPARPVVAQIANLFNELFGTNIASRCRKMEEEFNEYKAAVKHALPEFDDPGRMNAVVFHSAVILGISQRDLLEMAYDKVKWRQIDPNYKRTHPHEVNNGCGDCANFTNENVNGNGYCEAFKSEQSCGTCRCQEYKPKN